MDNTEGIADFYKNYREQLSRLKEASMRSLENQRNLAQQQIMAGANKAGMMYSNFPERSKIQYDTDTYIPAVQKAQTSYQTGLDALRNNMLKYQNQIAEINKSIADLNAL